NPDVVKLVDTSDLGSDAARCGGSSPSIRTIEYQTDEQGIKNFEAHSFMIFNSLFNIYQSINYHGSSYQRKHWPLTRKIYR
ncbi:MAG: hypothetical protein RIR12_2374, partial [Bacteroidota bacterium]